MRTRIRIDDMMVEMIKGIDTVISLTKMEGHTQTHRNLVKLRAAADLIQMQYIHINQKYHGELNSIIARITWEYEERGWSIERIYKQAQALLAGGKTRHDFPIPPPPAQRTPGFKYKPNRDTQKTRDRIAKIKETLPYTTP